MPRTYVLGARASVIDFDRASFLMDRKLLHRSIYAMRRERDTCPRPDARYGAQWVFDYYCGRHYEKFGEYFVPSVSPHWDSRGASHHDRERRSASFQDMVDQQEMMIGVP
jgi:hypothetical protein